jgi:SAM-dependent methyltransferase
MPFGDGIDWAAEARRAAAEDAARPSAPPGRFEFIDRLVGLLPERGRVLDAGCNIGRYCPGLVSAGFGYVGVDQSEEALTIARERNPGTEFRLGFLWDFIAETPFDAAISLAVLQHNVLDEKERILPRIAAAVREGGIFLLSESTVHEETRTQLTHQGWIALVRRHGFELLGTWHQNELGFHDAYAFRRS